MGFGREWRSSGRRTGGQALVVRCCSWDWGNRGKEGEGERVCGLTYTGGAAQLLPAAGATESEVPDAPAWWGGGGGMGGPRRRRSGGAGGQRFRRGGAARSARGGATATSRGGARGERIRGEEEKGKGEEKKEKRKRKKKKGAEEKRG
jgi:hypothetical protein